MRQELVTTFLKKSSASDKNSCRGSLPIQSFGTQDGPERAVNGSSIWQKTIQPIIATDAKIITPKMGQTNQKDRTGKRASNGMTGKGQVTGMQGNRGIGTLSPGQKLNLGGGS